MLAPDCILAWGARIQPDSWSTSFNGQSYPVSFDLETLTLMS